MKKLKRKYRCIVKIGWRDSWRLALRGAFPGSCIPWEIFISPITVPLLFFCRAYQSYNVAAVIDSLNQLTELMKRITSAAEVH